MTTITVVIDRDADGRLHGTIERGRSGAGAVRFSGVIEMVAQIEASLDQPEDAQPSSREGGGSRPPRC